MEQKITKQRVLLLDDDANFRAVISALLVSRSYEVIGVSNGADGLKEILKAPFDLILCDMMMPQMNGEMFHRAVTRIRPAARLRFLFVTGHQNDLTIESFFQWVSGIL